MEHHYYYYGSTLSWQTVGLWVLGWVVVVYLAYRFCFFVLGQLAKVVTAWNQAGRERKDAKHKP